MLESLFVAAALGAGGPVPQPPVEPQRDVSVPAYDTALAEALARAARAHDERLVLALIRARPLPSHPAYPVVLVGAGQPANGTLPASFDRLVELRLPVPTAEMRPLVVRTCVAADCVRAGAELTPVAPAPRAVPAVTASYQVRNAAAADVAEAVGRALVGGGEVRVDVVRNQVVVTGLPETHARVARLVGELDRPVPQVIVTTLVAEVPERFLADCGLTSPAGVAGCWSLSPRELALFMAAFRLTPDRSIVSRPQLQTNDNQTGYVQIGSSEPVGPGVVLRVTPRLMPEGKVQLRVEFQATTPAVAPAGGVTYNAQSVQTTVLVPAGQTTVIAGPTTAGADGKRTTQLLLLTPAPVRADGP